MPPFPCQPSVCRPVAVRAGFAGCLALIVGCGRTDKPPLVAEPESPAVAAVAVESPPAAPPEEAFSPPALEALDPDSLSPREALEALYRLKRLAQDSKDTT